MGAATIVAASGSASKGEQLHRLKVLAASGLVSWGRYLYTPKRLDAPYHTHTQRLGGHSAGLISGTFHCHAGKLAFFVYAFLAPTYLFRNHIDNQAHFSGLPSLVVSTTR
jgi:hypothetical protein